MNEPNINKLMKYYEPPSDCSVDSIRHKGKVKEVEGSKYHISILAESACSACSVKGACNVSGLKEEMVEVPREPDSNFKVGDEVTVYMEKSLGPRAVILGYGIPFLLLFITLILTATLTGNEGLAGVLSVLIVVPYYILLYIYRDRLKKTFVFRLR